MAPARGRSPEPTRSLELRVEPYVEGAQDARGSAALSCVGRLATRRWTAMLAGWAIAVLASACIERDQHVIDLVGDPVRGGNPLYANICARCHGADGAGVAGKGPDLRPIVPARTDRQLADTILYGTAAGSPAFGPSLTDQEVADLLAYLRVTFP